MRRRNHRAAGREARRERARRRHRHQPRRGRQRTRAEPRPRQLQVPARRRNGPARARGRPLRPRRQHLRSDVRSQAVRRRQGARPGHATRRPDRHGQLDPQRSDAGRPGPADQRGLLAAAARRFRQPHDLGGGAQRDRALRGRGRTRREDLVREKHLHVQLPRHTDGASRRIQDVLRPNHERVRRRNRRPAARPSCRPSWTRCSTSTTPARADDTTSIPATFLRVTVTP